MRCLLSERCVMRATRQRNIRRPPRLDDAWRLEGDDNAVLRKIADYYHEKLKATPAALDYLAARGLGSAQLIDHFRLGYSDQSLSGVLPQKDTKLGRETRGRLTRLGIIAGGRERFLGCLVVPSFGAQGEVVGMY